MKIAVIGAGNMGGATARGLVKAGAVKASDVTVSDISPVVLATFSALGYNTTKDNSQAVKGADVVFLVVKPWLVEELINEIRPELDYSSQIIVCIAAGISPQQLSDWLGIDSNGAEPQSLLAIPNTAIEILQSMTFITPVMASPDSVETVKSLFNSVGTAMVIDYDHMGAATALASCGIAYAMRYIRASAEGGVEMGFYPADAVKIVCQTVQGAAGLLSQPGAHPEAEIDKVTTPGGITIKGLNEMEHAGFTSAVIRGLKASKK